MKNILLIMLGIVMMFGACTDPDLDPLLLDQVQKGAHLALRGTAYDNLAVDAYLSAIDSVSKSKGLSGNLAFEADFIAEDITSLDKAIVYASADENAQGGRVGEVSGSTFAVKTGGKYPTGKFSFPMVDVFKASGKALADYKENGYVFVSIDLTLKDGRTVKASSVVNGNLFESDLFYPAHAMRVVVKK